MSEAAASRVGWGEADADLAVPAGVLVAHTEFASPLTGEPISVIATTPEEALA